MLSLLTRRKKSVERDAEQSIAAEDVLLAPPDNTAAGDHIAFINLTENDLIIAKELQPFVEEQSEQLADTFFDDLLRIPHLKETIHVHSSAEKLKETLKVHITEMFSGKMDEEYFIETARISKEYFQIGVPPKWLTASLQNLLISLIHIIGNNYNNNERRMKAVETVTRILNLEQQLMTESYEDETVINNDNEQDTVKMELKQKITVITEELAAMSQQTTASVSELIKSSSAVSSIVSESAVKSKETKEEATQGGKKISGLINRMSALEQSSQTMGTLTLQLNESSQEIERVIGIVKGIADQTNLLALNSAIEAARAGEHGRGFAVVADEVRKLSEQTKKSVETIEELVKKSSAYIMKVNDAISEAGELVKEGVNDSGETDESFQRIGSALQDTIENVSTAEEEFKSLLTVINEIGDASNQVAASAEKLNEMAKDG